MKIYGQTHSPWVQAVLLGAAEKRLDHQLVTATPSAVLSRWGVLMPAAKFDGAALNNGAPNGGGWMRNSPDILEQMGYSPLEEGVMGKLQAAWMGVLHRPDRALASFVNLALLEIQAPDGFDAPLKTFCVASVLSISFYSFAPW